MTVQKTLSTPAAIGAKQLDKMVGVVDKSVRALMGAPTDPAALATAERAARELSLVAATLVEQVDKNSRPQQDLQHLAREAHAVAVARDRVSDKDDYLQLYRLLGRAERCLNDLGFLRARADMKKSFFEELTVQARAQFDAMQAKWGPLEITLDYDDRKTIVLAGANGLTLEKTPMDRSLGSGPTPTRAVDDLWRNDQNGRIIRR